MRFVDAQRSAEAMWARWRLGRRAFSLFFAFFSLIRLRTLQFLVVVLALASLCAATNLSDEEVKLLNHFGYNANAVAASSLSNEDVDEGLLHDVKAEKGVPDYLNEDELKTLRHFGWAL